MLDHVTTVAFFAQNILAQPGPGGGGAPGGAGGAAGATGAPPQDGGMMSILFLGGLLLFMYFVLIRPQQKRAKKHQALVNSLKRGDNVITTGGIYGKVVAMDGPVVTMEIAKNTNIKVLRHFVGGRANEETEKELTQNPT